MLLSSALLLASWACASASKLLPIASFGVSKPAFLTSFSNPSSGTLDLVISSFGVGIRHNPDAVHIVSDIQSRLIAGGGKGIQPTLVGDHPVWPNEVSRIGEYVYVPGGFLVPGKRGHVSRMLYSDFISSSSDGSVQQQAAWEKIVDERDGFYHRVASVKVFGKGGEERIVTCRGRKGLIGKGSGEMVYLNPSTTTSTGFEPVVIAPGCDVFFQAVDLNQDGVPEFIIPEFFGSKLVLMWTEDADGDYTKADMIRTRVIDESIGMVFDVQVQDVDGDGKLEIVVTNHENDRKAPLPSLITYKIVSNSDAIVKDGQHILDSRPVNDFMNSIVFEKTVISNDFHVLGKSPQAAAPGAAIVVYPHVSKSLYPVLIVSGDDSQKAFIFTRNEDGSYQQEVFHDCKGTVGGIHAIDVDGDGWTEVFVPCYTKDEVNVFSFKPSSV